MFRARSHQRRSQKQLEATDKHRWTQIAQALRSVLTIAFLKRVEDTLRQQAGAPNFLIAVPLWGAFRKVGIRYAAIGPRSRTPPLLHSPARRCVSRSAQGRGSAPDYRV